MPTTKQKTIFSTLWQYRFWWILPALSLALFLTALLLLGDPGTERPFIYTVH